MIPVYSRNASDEFNQCLHGILVEIADEVERSLGDNLVALVLGGGYGRGEGGVVWANDREMPYNDLDFTLIVARKNGVPWNRLNAIGHSFGKKLDIHVDFSRPLTLQDVEQWPHWLMWYDLLNGHVVLKGTPDILSRHAPASLLEPLPVIEGTRLLLNRGAGVLWALRILRGVEESPDADFVRRNYYKCALALGDALLIAYERFTTQYLGRDELFANLEQDRHEVRAFGLQSLYRQALQFKFRPDEIPHTDLREQDLHRISELWGAVFLHVEMVRTGLTWPSLKGYVEWHGIREGDQHSSSLILRNVTRNLQMGRLSWKYPREILYRDLPLLLGLVELPVADWSQRTAAFLKVWNRFN